MRKLLRPKFDQMSDWMEIQRNDLEVWFEKALVSQLAIVIKSQGASDTTIIAKSEDTKASGLMET